jgi:hypothetical protein
VVGAAVPDQQVEEIDWEQRVLGGAGLLGRGDPMLDPTVRQAPQRSGIGRLRGPFATRLSGVECVP